MGLSLKRKAQMVYLHLGAYVEGSCSGIRWNVPGHGSSSACVSARAGFYRADCREEHTQACPKQDAPETGGG